MRNISKKAFTLVELLVVITILSIISVVAYQNFGGAVDKAVSGRKTSDIWSLKTSLAQYKVDKNSYPPVGEYDATTNMWWYDNTATATASNTLDLTYSWDEILSINSANGGGRIYGSWSWNTRQIGAKGTISQEQLGKQYLTKDLYDPEIGDLKETTNNKKLIDSWIGRYTYSVYKKPKWTDWGTSNLAGSYYNIAYTVKKDWSDTYVTKIIWDYDEESCFDNANLCLPTLIWSNSTFLVDDQEQWKDNQGGDLTNFNSDQPNQGIPYPVE